MSARTVLRRTYDGLALFALLNFVALLGVVAYAVGTGRLDHAGLARVAGALRDDPPPVSPRPSLMGAEQRETVSTRGGDVQTPVELEMLRREADRVRAELDQQMTLVQSMMIKTAGEREALKQQQRQASALPVEAETVRARRDDGLRKQIEIYEQLAPKVALEHLLGVEDIDLAARILSEMETRKAKKVVEAARSADKSARIQAILQRIQDVAPVRSGELDNQEP